MTAKSSTCLQTFSLRPSDAERLREMIASRIEFLAIEITINPNRETYSPFQAEHVPAGEVLVALCIPHEDIDMPSFYREFWQVLNSEGKSATRRERE